MKTLPTPVAHHKCLIRVISCPSWFKIFQTNHQQSSINNRKSPVPLISPLLLSLFLFSSCANKPTETPPPTEKKEQARLVGRIASIHKNQNFVLIQSYGTWTINTGAILAAIGPDNRAANLKVTGEKSGQFAAADIQSGTLEIGDSVYTTLSPPKTQDTTEVNEEIAPTPDRMTPAAHP